ncbi:MAG: 1-(5-phosphoribosyl)-5-[(5-phosphoribosylamino)methylideneamino]imidazole-4-carboxamide isomerase [Clostridia bacterium]|jgi:phosphoribosylformimino-5-aminoimidazole carboxamide ribotide isomerase
MIIYPAIDIKNGKCVRLVQGDPNHETVYGDDPVEIAHMWEDAGAVFIHVVDLDGAFTGNPVNLSIVKEITRSVQIPVQLGGGIRTLDDIAFRLEDIGVERVVLGTAVLETPDIVVEGVERFPGRIVAGLDAKNGKVSIRGWVQDTEQSIFHLADKVKQMRIDTIIYTDISRDGMLSGPNFDITAELIDKTGMNIIASGGIHHMNDIIKLKNMGASGVIIGKSLYTGDISIQSALALQEE